MDEYGGYIRDMIGSTGLTLKLTQECGRLIEFASWVEAIRNGTDVETIKDSSLRERQIEKIEGFVRTEIMKILACLSSLGYNVEEIASKEVPEYLKKWSIRLDI